MQQDYTHICIVLDASGSMSSIREDVKGTFNTFLDQERKQVGKHMFDLYQFSDETTRLVRAADLAQYTGDLMSQYECHGCTAMNDAICEAIDTLGQELAAMPESLRPENVLVVIITDGMENASRKWTTKDVHERIQHQKEKYQWDFLFLGANLDAQQAGSERGLDASQCVQFEATPRGVIAFAPVLCDAAENSRKRARGRRHGTD